jgi:probable F420-dependent oxidoreductase
LVSINRSASLTLEVADDPWKERDGYMQLDEVKIGAVFPQAAIAAAPDAVREYVAGVDELGFDHMLIFDTVVGADRARHPNLAGAYRQEHLFHELLVLLGFAAATAPELELATAVVIAPQRQTALLAKQTAEIDILTRGRFRCGLAVGHDDVSFEALGMNFHDRGKRFEEQVELLRRYWTEDVFDFDGRWHKVTGAGINPLPRQRPIPIWMGGSTESGIRRAARLGDGFFPHPNKPLPGGWPATIHRLRGWVAETGRDPASFGVEPWIDVAGGTPEQWRESVDEWLDLGITHLGLKTTILGEADASSPDLHLDRLREARSALGLESRRRAAH